MHQGSNHAPHRRLALLLALFALIAGACGARLDDEQRAMVQARGSSDADVGADAGQPGPGSADDTTGTTRTTSATGTDPGGGGGGGGGAGDPGGGGGGGGPGVAGSSCAGGGDSGVGVSAEQIRIGNVSTLSGPVPGFGQTGINGVKAYFAMKNSGGGVCGREITLVTSDDRLDAGVNRSEAEKLASEVLGFVGNTTVVDDGGAAVIDAEGIPDTSLAVGPRRVASPYNFSPNPIDESCNCNGAAKIFTWLIDNEGVETAALIGPNQATARARAQSYKTDLDQAGIRLVYEAEVPVAETNYGGVATRIRNNGADLVVTTLEINGMARLAKALDQAGYQPAAPFYGAQVYGRQFLELAGNGANGTKVGLGYSIFEDREQVPAVDEFLTWYGRVNPGADMDFFAIMGWVAADMFVTALEQSGRPPSREGVLEQLRTFTDYDADGFLAPINPAEKQGSNCFMIAGVENGSWQRQFPDQGFQC